MLSAIIITKNEASNIQDCIASVAFADEVIVVDSGSTDNTQELARSGGAKVFVRDDWRGFGVQKNRALDLASGDWVFSIDADERVPPQLAEEIIAAVQADQADIWDVPRRTYFCGQWIDHCGWSPDRVVRLFRKDTARFNENLVHESLHSTQLSPRRQSLVHSLLHYSYPTPNHYWDKLKIYSEAWARQKQLEGRKTSIARGLGSSLVAFIRSYFFRGGFLDGSMGFVVCQMQAQATFYKYFYLYYLNRTQNKMNAISQAA